MPNTSGPFSGGKGASNGQNQIANNEDSLLQKLNSDYATTFSNQQSILSGLTKNFTSMVNAGPNQFGFSAPETSALNTLATTQNANAYQQARAAAGAASAAAGGGANLPTGANAAVQANLAQKAAEQESNSLLGIQEAGYNQGRQNWQSAVSGLENVSAQENPTAYSGQAIQQGNDAFNAATTIQKENQAASPWAQVGGLVGSLAGTALNFIPGVGPALGAGVKGLTKDITQGYNNAANMSTADDLSSSLSIQPKQLQNLSNLPSY